MLRVDLLYYHHMQEGWSDRRHSALPELDLQSDLWKNVLDQSMPLI